MLEIVGVLLCVGAMETPDMDRCAAFNDTQGPYETEAACRERLDEIAVTWPPMFAQALSVPTVSLFHTTDTCQFPGITS